MRGKVEALEGQDGWVDPPLFSLKLGNRIYPQNRITLVSQKALGRVNFFKFFAEQTLHPPQIALLTTNPPFFSGNQEKVVCRPVVRLFLCEWEK